MPINTSLLFDGKCEEAITLYAKVLGGKIEAMMSHEGTPAEAERVYGAHSEGGKVTMPLAETFRAQKFGMFVDRFGTPWMVNCEKKGDWR